MGGADGGGADGGLLEREEDLRVVSGLLGVAAHGAGQIVVVEGPSGIGKTSFARACCEQAAGHGFLVLKARGSDLESDFAFGVARQLYEPLRYGPARHADLLAGVSARAAGALDALALPPAAAPAQDISVATMHGLYWLAVDLAGQQPVLLCIDDIHWCDEPTVRYLAYLGKRLEDHRVLLLATLRSGARPVAEHTVGVLLAAERALALRLRPLSPAGTARLVRDLVSPVSDDAFRAAFHQATGGNPFLLRELAAVARDEGLTPDSAGAARVLGLGGRLVSRRVLALLSRLAGGVTAVADAVAVLGECTTEQAATVAGVGAAAADQAVPQLAGAGILHEDQPLRFVHPLVRAAVYDGLSHARRAVLHAAAALALSSAGAPAEQVAAHLVLSPGSGDQRAVAALRLAAEHACARGSPRVAVRYLQRCLAEPPEAEVRIDVLERLGTVAAQVDMVVAAEALAAVLPARTAQADRSRVAHLLGQTLILLGRFDDAVRVLTAAVEQAEPGSDWRDRLDGALLLALAENVTGSGGPGPAVGELAARIRGRPPPRVTGAAAGAGAGASALDCIVGCFDLAAGDGTDPAGWRDRVGRAIADGSVITRENGGDAWCCACLFLAGTDAEDIGWFIDRSIAQAHEHGSAATLAIVKIFSGLALYWRGELADAEAHLNDAVELVETTQLAGLRPQAGAFLGYCLTDQGRIDDAAAALSWAWPAEQVPELGYWHWLLLARARLLLARGEPERALAAAMACGSHCDRRGWRSPLILAWRCDAALAEQLLGRTDQARTLAAHDLALARRWAAPRALGLALRVTGLLEGGQAGLPFLAESVAVLSGSSARLEHAKSLVEVGAAHRRLGRRMAAREHLQRGIDLATACGAAALAERGRAEMLATGTSLGSRYGFGPDALTASERRIAELAAAGRSNKEIAQGLFITPKTVEVHLTNIYRKLDIASRAELAAAITR